MTIQKITAGTVIFGGKRPFVLIAGPCVLEDERTAFACAGKLKKLTDRLKVPFVFKASYDKANRTSLSSFRGPGVRKGLAILAKIKKEFKCPLLSDVHKEEEVPYAADVLDILQVPAFLCRQTDLIVALAKTKKIVNIKKGQFLAPLDMQNIIRKITSCGNKNILLTERGSSFGYNNLVVDLRSLEIMSSFGYPVIFDATHSVQLPGAGCDSSSGESRFVAGLSRAAIAFGCDGIFLEVHPDPSRAKCDGPNSLALDRLENLLKVLKDLDGKILNYGIK